jgi:hypothetical protein
MDARYHRNVEVDEILEIWDWCSRRRHVKWQRKPKLRNGCYIGLACALSDSEGRSITPVKLLKTYRTLPQPLLRKDQVEVFWQTRPLDLLELCLGSYSTRASPLLRPLNRVRSTYQNNATLDELAKKMRCRQERFRGEWFTEGHHPDREVRSLKKEIAPLCDELAFHITSEAPTVSRLSLDVLAKGWQFGEIPACSRVRTTPEKLLNKTSRLKLWQAAQQILSRDLEEEDMLKALWDLLHRKIDPALKAAIEAQGYSLDDVVGDLISFDLYKTRDEITA